MQEKLIHLENDAYSAFSSAFRILLKKHAPLKAKILTCNKKIFITKDLEISTVKNIFNKNKVQEYWCKYKIHKGNSNSDKIDSCC